LLTSKINKLQNSGWIKIKFSGKMHNDPKNIPINFGCKNFSFEKVVVLHRRTAQPCQIG